MAQPRHHLHPPIQKLPPRKKPLGDEEEAAEEPAEEEAGTDAEEDMGAEGDEETGSIEFDGKDVSRMPAYVKAELGLVLVPEGRQLFTDMTVLENLEMGATNRRARGRVKENQERVFAFFPRLAERKNQRSGTMSGGEQQMLAVARGIMAEPTILIIDELSLGLAPVLALQLFQNLKQLKQTGLTILLVEQNVQMALAVSDYGYVLAQGRVELEGPARQLINDQHVRAAYLGL